ncbi:hypothetical protein [Thiomicrospira pelophila]|uniref:hypothetical protein n=1 Tax=Thiomicrospira pelophila TaxID=934 RepID=UPI0004A786FB|nr:hypothetical protein [Thiomicrospira pelophila]
MENGQILVYLDHNVLDLMTKGDPLRIKNILKENDLTPVYSNESLKEIQRSVGYVDKFIDVLDVIEAKYIEPILDRDFKQTGQARLNEISPELCYRNFLENQNNNEYGDFGITKFLMKFYGGQQESSFSDIFEQGAIDLQKHLKELLVGVDSLSVNKSVDVELLEKLIDELPVLMQELTSPMAKELDEQELSPVSAFETATASGAKVLKNINPPNVIEKIWQKLSKVDGFSGVDMDSFFGIRPDSFEVNQDRERTIQEKVNAVYHQLNIIGYYRDSKMKKDRRFRASFSDMTHAGVASFCHWFFCKDEDLVMKAAAAYEYIGVQTKIVHFKDK